MITETTTLSRENVKSQTEAELAIELAEKTRDFDQVLVLTSTTTIDRFTTLVRVANKTGKTIIWDILLNMVLQLVTQKIPNALNSNKVYCYLPSYLYRMRNQEPYKQYIEQYSSKIKQTGQKLHGKFIMNCRASMWRDIEKLKLKNKVLDNCCVVYSIWDGYKTQDELTMKFLNTMSELSIPIIDRARIWSRK